MFRKLLALALFSIFSLTIFGQKGFKAAYFVNPAGEVVPCFILDEDWRNTPSFFSFKFKQSDKLAGKLNVEDAQLVVIDSSVYYHSVFVEMDTSTTNIERLDFDPEPKLHKTKIFIKQLVKGEAASLFTYRDRNKEQFFVKLNEETPFLLVHKHYLVKTKDISGNEAVAKLENNTFIKQLMTSVNCYNEDSKQNFALAYKEASLIKYILQYNKCKGSKVTFINKGRSHKLYVNVSLGIQSSALRIEYFNRFTGLDQEFGSLIGFKTGLESEINFDFNHRSWSMLLGGWYHRYEVTLNPEAHYARYNSLELGGGPRYYIALFNKTYLLLDAQVFIDVPIESNFYLDVGRKLILEGKVSPGFKLGTGVSFNKKLSLNYRYSFARDPINSYIGYTATYNTHTVFVTYSL